MQLFAYSIQVRNRSRSIRCWMSRASLSVLVRNRRVRAVVPYLTYLNIMVHWWTVDCFLFLFLFLFQTKRTTWKIKENIYSRSSLLRSIEFITIDRSNGDCVKSHSFSFVRASEDDESDLFGLIVEGKHRDIIGQVIRWSASIREDKDLSLSVDPKLSMKDRSRSLCLRGISESLFDWVELMRMVIKSIRSEVSFAHWFPCQRNVSVFSLLVSSLVRVEERLNDNYTSLCSYMCRDGDERRKRSESLSNPLDL